MTAHDVGVGLYIGDEPAFYAQCHDCDYRGERHKFVGQALADADQHEDRSAE
jgi:hypothetical protein